MNDDRFDVLDRFEPLFETPEPAFEGFVRRRDRRRRNQRITAGVVGITVFVAAVWIVSSGGPSDRIQTPGASGPPIVTGPAVPHFPMTLSRTVEGVPFSITVPEGWSTSTPLGVRLADGSGFREGNFLITNSIMGPQGAEAVIFWTSSSGGHGVDTCSNLLDTSGGTTADLASTVAAAPGTDLVEGPSNATVGGYPAKHVVLTVREDRGCDPGFFFTWRTGCWGECWTETNVDDTVEVWIVDVAGKRVFIEAETTTQADSALRQEIQQIVGSIRF